jgi:hypothetical protein
VNRFWTDAILDCSVHRYPLMPCGQRLRSYRPGPFYFGGVREGELGQCCGGLEYKNNSLFIFEKIKPGQCATKAVLLLDAVSFPSVLDFTDDDYQYGQHHDRSGQRCQRRKHCFAALRATMPETCSARVCSKVAANIRRLEVGHHLVAGGVS